jgi:acyl-CoA thioester hydrolase
MGVVYYAKYLEYFEVARTEMLRSMGLPYREIEEKGYELPVSEASIKYYKGAGYDDELQITASLTPKNSPRVEIHYEVKRASDGELVAEGETTLVFVDAKTGKPTRAPQFYLDVIAV